LEWKHCAFAKGFTPDGILAGTPKSTNDPLDNSPREVYTSPL
jgi:hypothetical protein